MMCVTRVCPPDVPCHCCNTMQCTAMHCNALQHTFEQILYDTKVSSRHHRVTAEAHCNTVHHTATRNRVKAAHLQVCDTWEGTSPCHCYNTLQLKAKYCNALQHVEIHCNALQHTDSSPGDVTCHCCNTLQNAVSRCSTLQHT